MTDQGGTMVAGPELVLLPPVEVYKSDGRSKVWRVEAGGGSLVIKEFQYWPLRQVLGWLTGLHPGQLERSRARMLHTAGVPHVRIAGWGRRGGRFWLASPACGQSLQRLFKDGALDDRATRRPVLRGLGQLAGRLVEQGLFFRDLRTSNIVLDPTGPLRLIDYGSTRRSHSRAKMLEMLDILDRSLQRDGLSRSDRLRVAKGFVEGCSRLGDVRRLVGEGVGAEGRG